MNFSKENQLSFADTDVNHLFRDHLHQAAFRYNNTKVSQKQKPPNKKPSFCQSPQRLEKALFLFRQRNQEKY